MNQEMFEIAIRRSHKPINDWADHVHKHMVKFRGERGYEECSCEIEADLIELCMSLISQASMAQIGPYLLEVEVKLKKRTRMDELPDSRPRMDELPQ